MEEQSSDFFLSFGSFGNKVIYAFFLSPFFSLFEK